MGKRSRRRERAPDAPAALPDAPTADYPGADGQVLTLRCVLTLKTRAQYAEVLHGNTLSQEDAWHRAVEFLFERLARALDDQRRRDRGAEGPAAAAARRDGG